MDSDTEDYESDQPRRPEKRYSLFHMDEGAAVSAREVVEGQLGGLPLLIGVTSGYDHELPDPFMHPYESQEVLFAYDRGRQIRALIQDSHLRTLSLPVTSDLTFHVEGGEMKLTLSQILSRHSLPVNLRLARAHCLGFVVDGKQEDHTYFGPLRLANIYEEPYLLCGTVRGAPKVLPRNLLDVLLAPVCDVTGAANAAVKIKEFKDQYSKLARHVSLQTDPFFQELAVVSHGPIPVMEVEPYIDENTFIPIRSKLPPLPPPSLRRAAVSLPRPKAQLLETEKSRPRMSLNSPLSDLTERFSYLDSSASTSSCQQNALSAGDRAHKDQPKPAEDKPLHRDLLSAKCADSDCDDSDRVYDRVSDTLSEIPARPPTWKDTLDTVSVDEMSRVLQSLGLRKYRKVFARHRIDGVLLQKLTLDTLRTEFKMAPLEIIRLNAFTQEGHIPIKKRN